MVAAGSMPAAASSLCRPVLSRPAIPTGRYKTAPTTEAGFHLRLVKIPFARCKALIEREQDLSARPLHVEPGLTTLFADYFASFVEQAPHLHGVGAEAAVQTLAQLAIIARGMASPQEQRGRDAIRTGLLQRARANHREQHLSIGPFTGGSCRPARHFSSAASSVV